MALENHPAMFLGFWTIYSLKNLCLFSQSPSNSLDPKINVFSRHSVLPTTHILEHIRVAYSKINSYILLKLYLPSQTTYLEDILRTK